MNQNNLQDLAKTIGVDVMNALKEVFDTNKSRKVRIAVIGQTGVGKTSTVNALFNTNLPVSHFGSCTQEPEPITVKTDKAAIELINTTNNTNEETETTDSVKLDEVGNDNNDKI